MMKENDVCMVFKSRQHPEELERGRISLYGSEYQHFMIFSCLIEREGEKLLVTYNGKDYEATIDEGAIMLSGLEKLIKDMGMDSMKKPGTWTLSYNLISECILINDEMR